MTAPGIAGPTISELAEHLGVSVTDVAKAAMSLGLSRTQSQRFTADEAATVEKLLRLDAERPPAK